MRFLLNQHAPRQLHAKARHLQFLQLRPGTAVVFCPCQDALPRDPGFAAMLFDFDRLRARVSAREEAPRPLEQRQRDVYDSHRHRVFSVSFYMTGNELEAEQILGDTFVRAFRKADEPDAALVDAALIEQLQEHLVLEDVNLPFPGIDGLPSPGNILRTDLEEAIRALPPVERLIFLLLDVEGYSPDRAAALLHKTRAEVLRTSMLARLRLRAEIAAMRSDGEKAA